MSHKVVSFANLTPRDQFIVGQMALDKIPTHIQEFYLNVMDYLATEFATTKILAQRECYAERTVSNYMRLLQQKGYVMRYNYRAWVLGNSFDEDGYVLRSNNVFGKGAMREGCRI
jgi:hypothetical protein